MHLNIDINLSRCGCLMTAIDKSDFTDLPDGITFVEFLSYFAYDDDEDSLVPVLSSKKVSNAYNNDYISYNYTVNYDGRYVYSKYGIYNIDYLLSGDEYVIKDKIFYYNGNIYLGLANVSDPSEINGTNAETIANWYTLKEYIGSHINYYYTTELFTFCKLNKCVINYQKQTIAEKLKSCNNICADDDMSDLRNFLFVTLYVLDYLVCTGNYSEAQRILESLSACGNLCDDSVFTNSTNCGCK